LQIANYATLARLPPGLVVTSVDFAPSVLALTPHSVLAGPYHRQSQGILATHRAFTLPPDGARQVLRDFNVTYVATCGPKGPHLVDEQALAASLWGRLQEGAIPDWLELIPTTRGEAFTVYRVRS
jgi:hypothetical protein